MNKKIYGLILILCACVSFNPPIFADSNYEEDDYEERQPFCQPSDNIQPSINPDLVLFQLKGPVKSVKIWDDKPYFDINEDTYEKANLAERERNAVELCFDNNGKALVSGAQHDALGRLTEAVDFNVCFDMRYTIQWKNGRPFRKEWHTQEDQMYDTDGENCESTVEYYYDNYGTLTKVVRTEIMGLNTSFIVYSDHVFDPYGNWVKRKATKKYYDEDGSEVKYYDVDDNEVKYEWMEYRRISYH